MRFLRRYLHYLIIMLCFVGLVGLGGLSLAADQPVTIADPNLEAVIRETLNQPYKPLHASTLSKITTLEAPGRGIRSLEGIEALTNLTVLNLYNNAVRDVRPLARSKKLRRLNLSTNSLVDLNEANFGALRGTSLKELDLSYNVIIRESGERIWLTDIHVLGEIPSLTTLTLRENRIEDFSGLSALKNLKTLDLEMNRVQDITPLRSMASLKSLNLGNNAIIHLDGLSGLSQLTSLSLHGNPEIQTLLPLQGLTLLKTLTLDQVRVGADIRLLSNKHNLQELSISVGQVTDISALAELHNLRKLNLRENDIVDLSPLSGLTRLTELNLQSNRHVSSLSVVGNLRLLEKLDIQDVPVGEAIWVLANLHRLRFLDARNCGISNTNALGVLMAQGALQDNEKAGLRASVDLRDNPVRLAGMDGYHPVRAYWNNISDRVPFVLPEYATLAAPVFSVGGGFYSAPVPLSLSTTVAGADIYYTLDGSEPTRESIRYQAPITIQSRMNAPNVLANIDDVSTRWKAPSGKVAKATVVRARVIAADGSAISPVVTNTYFVAMRRVYTLPVISIVTNPAYFFDYQHGIYVLGEIYDQNLAATAALNPWERPANYKQTGDAWERPVHLEYFDTAGARRLSQNVQVRIHGAATREQPQKSLRVYAGCDNGCEGGIAFPLFPGLVDQITGQPIESFETFLLRNSGNDWGSTMFRDALVQSLVEHTRLDTQAYQPTVVFLNGEYWGIHNLRERLDEYYIQNHYGIQPGDVVILTENAALEVGGEGDQQHYLDMMEFIKTHDMKDAQNYAHVQTMMDMENFIDYQILEIYSNNNNWPQVNIKYWRKRTSAYQPDAPYGQDGRWRWMVYDTDFAFGLNEGMNGSSGNNLVNAIQPNWQDWAGTLLRSLLENPEFKEQFLNRFADLMNTAFEPKRVMSRVAEMKAVIEPEIEEHQRRWGRTNDEPGIWEKHVEVLSGFAQERPMYMFQQLVEYFQLSGTVTVHLESDPKAGYIHINSLDITADTPGVEDSQEWTGTYFRGLPLEINAVAKPGYRFEKWEASGAVVDSSGHLHLLANGNLSLRAIFTR